MVMKIYQETGTCALCGGPYEMWGNNPQPVLPHFHQRVCNRCNATKVIPVRLYRLEMQMEKKD